MLAGHPDLKRTQAKWAFDVSVSGKRDRASNTRLQRAHLVGKRGEESAVAVLENCFLPRPPEPASAVIEPASSPGLQQLVYYNFLYSLIHAVFVAGLVIWKVRHPAMPKPSPLNLEMCLPPATRLRCPHRSPHFAG